MKKTISFFAVFLISLSAFAQIKSGHGGMGSGGPNEYQGALDADEKFVDAFNRCINSKNKYTNFREIYLITKFADLSFELDKVGAKKDTLKCKGSNCIFAPEVKKHLENLLTSQSFDEYLDIYYGMESKEVKKDIKKWLAP